MLRCHGDLCGMLLLLIISGHAITSSPLQSKDDPKIT